MRLNAPAPEQDTWGDRIAEDLEMQRRDAEDDLHNEATEALAQKGALVEFLRIVQDQWNSLPDGGEALYAEHPWMRFDFAGNRARMTYPGQALESVAEHLHIRSEFVEEQIR